MQSVYQVLVTEGPEPKFLNVVDFSSDAGPGLLVLDAPVIAREGQQRLVFRFEKVRERNKERESRSASATQAGLGRERRDRDSGRLFGPPLSRSGHEKPELIAPAWPFFFPSTLGLLPALFPRGQDVHPAPQASLSCPLQAARPRREGRRVARDDLSLRGLEDNEGQPRLCFRAPARRGRGGGGGPREGALAECRHLELMARAGVQATRARVNDVTVRYTYRNAYSN